MVSINSNPNVVLQSDSASTVSKPVSFNASKTNTLERTPEKDVYNKKEKGTLKKVLTWAAVGTAIALILDLTISKGRNTKKLLGKADDGLDDAINKGNGYGSYGQDFFDDGLDAYNRGIYGQDIYNPVDPMNAYDATSPYYKPFGSDNGGLGYGY